MPTFNYQKALDAGYTPEQIDAFVQKNNLKVKRVQSPVTSSDMQQTQTPTPQPEMQAPQNVKQPTFNERIGQGVLDIGKNIISPFVRTGRNIAGGLVQAPLAIRAGDLANVVNDPNASDEAKDKALKELRRVNQLNKLLAPFAETGKTTDAYKQDAGQVISDPRVTKQAKDAINIASYGVPFGKGANILTKAVAPGAVVGAMQEASKDDATLAGIAGGAATGGLLSGAVYGATKVPSLIKKFTGKAGGAIQKTGEAVSNSNRNIRVDSGVWGASKEKAIEKTLNKLGIRGTSQKQYELIQPKFEQLTDEIETILEKNPKNVNLQSIVDDFNTNLKSVLRSKELTNKQAVKEINSYIQQLYQDATGKAGIFPTEISTLDLFRLKKLANQDYQGIVKKLANGTPLTPTEKVIQQARQTLDDVVANAHPDIKERTIMQSHLYDAAESLARSRNTIPTVRIAGTTLPGVVRQEAANVAGQAIEKTGATIAGAGNLLTPFSSVPERISNISANVASRFPSAYQPTDEAQNNQANITQEQKGGDIQSQVNHSMGSIDQLTTNVKTDPKNTKGQTGYSYNELTRAFAKAMMDGDTKLANRIKPLMELEKEALPKEAKTDSTTEKQRLYKSAAEAATQALKLLDTGKARTGFGTKQTAGLRRTTGLQSKEQQDFESTLSLARGALLNAFAGANVPPSEYERLAASLDIENSSPEVAKQQLKSFIKNVTLFADQK